MFKAGQQAALYHWLQIGYNIKKAPQEDIRLHIAICDDNEQERKRLARMLEHFAAEKGLTFSLHSFCKEFFLLRSRLYNHHRPYSRRFHTY